jgi:hypothetical protein
MHLGDGRRVRQVLRAWAAGDEVRGLALYWDMVYGHLARLLASDARVRAVALVVRFESIGAAPVETLRAVLGHCLLPQAEAVAERRAPGIRAPTSSPGALTPHDLDVIREETAATAALWGY